MLNNELIGAELGEYKLIKKIGRGGFGAIYEAENDLSQKFAIKILPITDTQELEYALRESTVVTQMETAKKINSSHLLRIYGFEFDISMGIFGIVMELLEGESLKNKLGKPMKVSESLDYIMQASLGLEKLHEKGLVHRDIKPENLFIEKANNLKLVDFGLIKDLSGRVTVKNTQLMGTVFYMAPEHLGGKSVTSQSDIYSLGMVLYEMLTGQLPYAEKYNIGQEQAVMNAVCAEKEPPTPVKDIRKELPDKIEKILNKMIEHDPNKRYKDCADLRAGILSSIEEFSASWKFCKEKIKNDEFTKISKAFKKYLKENIRNKQSLSLMVDVFGIVNLNEITLPILIDALKEHNCVLINIPDICCKLLNNCSDIKMFPSINHAQDYFKFEYSLGS